MSDTSTVEYKPSVNLRDAAFFNPNAMEGGPLRNAEAQARAEKARKLLTLKEEKRAKGQEIIEAARPKSEIVLDRSQLDELRLNFGAGRADVVDDKVEITRKDGLGAGQAAAVESSLREGKRAIDTVGAFLDYTQIRQEMDRTKKTAEEVCKDKNIGITHAEYKKARDRTLDTLLKTDTVRNLLGGLDEMSHEEQQETLERNFMRDPAVRRKVQELMRGIQSQADQLPEVALNGDYKQAETTKTEAEKKLKDSLDHAVDMLAADGLFGGDAGALKEELTDRINAGMSAEAALRTIQSRLLNQSREFQMIMQSSNKQRELAQARADLAKMDAKKTPIKAQEDQAAFVTQLEDEAKQYAAVVQQIPDVQGKLATIQEILAVTALKDQAGAPTQLASDFGEAVKARRDRDTANKIMVEKQSDAQKKEKASVATRLRSESDLISEINNVLPQAIFDVVNDRHAEMLRLDEEEFNNKGSEDRTAAVNKVREAMKKNWIRFDARTRRQEANYDRMSQDVKLLAYEGTEGVKRLMLRDLVESGAVTGVSWQSADLGQLAKDHPAVAQQLNEAQTQLGESYRNRLFADFFVSRGFADQIGLGKLSLHGHEWKLLNENFKEDIDRQINSKEETRQQYAEMQRRGMADGQSKWLLYILSFLGIKNGMAGSTTLGDAMKSSLAA